MYIISLHARHILLRDLAQTLLLARAVQINCPFFVELRVGRPSGTEAGSSSDFERHCGSERARAVNSSALARQQRVRQEKLDCCHFVLLFILMAFYR